MVFGNQDVVQHTHSHEHACTLSDRQRESPHTKMQNTHTYSLFHGKVGTNMRAQFELCRQTQISVNGSIFETYMQIHTCMSTYTLLCMLTCKPVPVSWAFLDRDNTVPAWLCEPGQSILHRINPREFWPNPYCKARIHLSLYISHMAHSCNTVM